MGILLITIYDSHNLELMVMQLRYELGTCCIYVHYVSPSPIRLLPFNISFSLMEHFP
jgi:hypothetical protein